MGLCVAFGGLLLLWSYDHGLVETAYRLFRGFVHHGLAAAAVGAVLFAVAALLDVVS